MDEDEKKDKITEVHERTTLVQNKRRMILGERDGFNRMSESLCKIQCGSTVPWAKNTRC